MIYVTTKLGWGTVIPPLVEVKVLPDIQTISWTCDGYRSEMVSEPTCNHALIFPFNTAITTPDGSYSDDECYCAGLVYGDGHIRKEGYGPHVTFYNKDPVLLDRWCTIYGCNMHKHDTIHSSQIPLHKFGKAIKLISIDLVKQLNWDELSKLSLRQLAMFFAGWIDADGCINISKTTGGWSVTITDNRYTNDVSVNLLRYGIVTSARWYLLRSKLTANNPFATFTIRNAPYNFWKVLQTYCQKLSNMSEARMRRKSIHTRQPVNRIRFHFTYSSNKTKIYIGVVDSTLAYDPNEQLSISNGVSIP